jgi:hypothetical protein
MTTTTWEKLPAIEGKHGGCLNCGPRPSYFPAEGQIAVGFGYAAVQRGLVERHHRSAYLVRVL